MRFFMVTLVKKYVRLFSIYHSTHASIVLLLYVDDRVISGSQHASVQQLK